MNKAILMGRLTHDPELRQTASGIPVTNFQIAVDRRFKNAQGERETDFIPIVCWRHQAEFVNRYFHKGQRIAVVGSIQVRSWTQDDGQRRYMTEVVADEVYFADGKSSGGGNTSRSNQGQSNYGNSYGDSNRSQSSYQSQSTDTSDTFEDDGFFAAPDDDTSLPFEL